MSRKWLEKEGHQWMKEGLIQKEQLEQILKRYPEKTSKTLLPIFASILVGLGILTFIASNWDIIPRLIKLLIIIFSMTSFYLAGNTKIAKGNHRLGHALVGLGIITFGAGTILINQMFHFTFNNAFSFILWSIGSLCMLLIFKSKFIFLLSALIIITGQIYSSIEYHTFSYILAFLLIFGTGHFVYHRASQLFSTVYAVLFLLMGFVYVINEDTSYFWLSVLALLLMIIAETPNKIVFFNPLRITGFIFQIFLVCFSIFMLDGILKYSSEQIPNVSYYIGVLLLVSIYLYITIKRGERLKFIYVIPFIPTLFLGGAADVANIFLLYLFAILALFVGYQYHKSEYVNSGTLVFLTATFVGYVQLAWNFMSKSMFFLSGGILLFVLSWILEKRRRKWLKESGGEPH